MQAPLDDNPAQEFSNTFPILLIGQQNIKITGDIQLRFSRGTPVRSIDELISNVYTDIGHISLQENYWFRDHAFLSLKKSPMTIVNNVIKHV